MGRKEVILLEMKRQAVHFFGIIFLIPLLVLKYDTAIKFFAFIVILALLLNWGYDRRQMRHKFFRAMMA